MIEPMASLKEIVLYIGTHKLVALEGEFDRDGARVLRYAVLKNPGGFESGLVVNLEKAAHSLQTLLSRLLGDTAVEDAACYVVLGNAKLRTYGFSSSQYFQGLQRSITAQEVRAVIHQTRSVATLPLSEFVLLANPESFLVNDLDGIRNPLGLEAHRLGVRLKMFTMNFQDFKNIHKAFEAAEIEVKKFLPKTLMGSEGILTDEEKEQGVLLLDIAEDVVHLTLWKNGYLAGTRALPFGGKVLTERIAEGYGIDRHDAQKAKEDHGSFQDASGFGDEIIPLVERNGKTNHTVRRQDFQDKFLEMATAWLENVITEANAFAESEKVFYPHHVVTGGGTRIEGFLEFLQQRFNWDARLGLVRKVEAPNELLIDPALAGGLGALRWLAYHEVEQKRLFEPQGILERTLTSARHWFATYF